MKSNELFVYMKIFHVFTGLYQKYKNHWPWRYEKTYLSITPCTAINYDNVVLKNSRKFPEVLECLIAKVTSDALQRLTNVTNGSRYSRMGQVKFVEDSLQKNFLSPKCEHPTNVTCYPTNVIFKRKYWKILRATGFRNTSRIFKLNCNYFHLNIGIDRNT